MAPVSRKSWVRRKNRFNPTSRFQHHRRETAEDAQLRLLLASNDLDVTENGTLRRKKKHHRSSKEHHRRHREDETVLQETNGEACETKQPSLEDFLSGERREKKTRRHRSSMLEGTLPLTEETFKNYTTNEMERGLLETLMATSDSSTLKRSKERRRSVKEKRPSKAIPGIHDLIRCQGYKNVSSWSPLQKSSNQGILTEGEGSVPLTSLY